MDPDDNSSQDDFDLKDPSDDNLEDISDLLLDDVPDCSVLETLGVDLSDDVPEAIPVLVDELPEVPDTYPEIRAVRVTEEVFRKPFRSPSRTNTSSIFAPRTKDMNEGFLTFDDEHPGLTSTFRWEFFFPGESGMLNLCVFQC